MAASARILVTDFAPTARVPIEVIHRQAATVADYAAVAKLVDFMPTYVLIVNAQRQVVFFTQNLRELLPAAHHREILGDRPGEVLDCLHAGQSPDGCGTTTFCQACGALKAILAGLNGELQCQECFMTRVLQDRTEALDLWVVGAPLLVKEDRFCVFTATDISHEKRRRVLERIFFHDIINGAGGLKGLASLLTEKTQGNAQAEALSLRDGLNDLIEEILAQKDLAAAENNELVVRHTTLLSDEVLNSVLSLYRNHPAAADRKLIVAPQPPSLSFTSDFTLVRRALGNLVKNALEASKPGQVVTLSCEALGGAVRFLVHNLGGMPPEAQLQVFNRSFTTKGAGRGLGTYAAKLLVERFLKGQMGFMSSPEEGTTFFMELPLSLA